MENKELAPIEKDLSFLSKNLFYLKIKSHGDMTIATEVRTKVKRYEDSLKKQKESLTKPINESLKNIRAMFRPLEDKCEELLNEVDTKMKDYNIRQQAKQEAIANKLANEEISTSSALRQIEKASTEKTVITKSGSVTFVDVKKFEVMDVTMLPIEYILPNEVAIRKAMLEGVELPGVRYYTEQSIRNSR